MNPASGATPANEPMEANATNTSGVPPMVFVDDEGLEEQFLTEDEDTANVPDTSANRVTTPVDTRYPTSTRGGARLTTFQGTQRRKHSQHH